MIDPKDLRIGNLIQLKSGRISRVIEITTHYLITSLIENNPDFLHGDKFATSGDWIKPITLTQTILEKCGFTIIPNPNHTNSFLGYLPMCKIVMSSEKRSITLRDYSGVQRSINYLHELQNIYYFFIGEELKYIP